MNISQLITKSARTYPNRLAMVHADKRYSYAQFDARINQLANALTKLGVRPSDHVAVLMYNCPQMLETMFACFKLGCAAVPINFRLHPTEFAYVIDHSQAKAVILSEEFNESILAVCDKFVAAKHLVTVSGGAGHLMDYNTLIADQPETFADVDVDPNDVAWLFYTSGTTGRPKGAMLTHRNLLAMTMNYYADIYPGIGPDDVVLHCAPLSHGSGLYALPNFGKAAAHVILESKSFEPEAVARTIEAFGITNLFAAPTMVNLLIDCPVLDQYDLSSLRAIAYGGGPILANDLIAAMKRLGPCLVQLYGLGESPMTITYLPHRVHVIDGNEQQMKRLGSAGFARTDTEVKVVDEHDRELPTGQTGQIITRSDLVMKGYWNDPQATEQTLRNGWLHTGDLGYLDEHGYLFIMDRSKDMIISGGENIYPR